MMFQKKKKSSQNLLGWTWDLSSQKKTIFTSSSQYYSVGSRAPNTSNGPTQPYERPRETPHTNENPTRIQCRGLWRVSFWSKTGSMHTSNGLRQARCKQLNDQLIKLTKGPTSHPCHNRVRKILEIGRPIRDEKIGCLDRTPRGPCILLHSVNPPVMYVLPS
jgi:hypothetical protein